jgi:hypothetical protein
VYIQAPAEEIGTAAGLQRTAMYVGAMAAASLLAMTYGERATDHGLHSLAAAMGILSALLFIATLFDPTIPAVTKSSGIPARPQSEVKTMPLTKLDDVPAMTDLDADAHRHSVEKVFPRLGEVATTHDVLDRLKNGRA